MSDDRYLKRQRVRSILETTPGARGITLSSPEVVSWYLDGVRTTVPFSGASVLSVLVTQESETIRCFENEHARLAAETPLAASELEPRPWDSHLLDGWVDDDNILPEAAVQGALRTARASLLPNEISRYRELGATVAAMVTDVAASSRPRMTELDLCAQVTHEIVAAGAEPLVLLAAGARRTGLRHPLPTTNELGARAMIVVGARRHGLIVNLTRWIHFDPPSPEIVDLDERIAAVEADVLTATVPGRSIGRVFRSLQRAYVKHGFAADEWMRHHQGGATGYFGRDPRATLASSELVEEHQAFAWNPSGPGCKVEDTVIASSAGMEILTRDERWPSSKVRGRQRPVALQV